MSRKINFPHSSTGGTYMDHLSSIHSEIFKPLILLRRLRCKMSSYMLLTSASQVLCEVGRHFAANFIDPSGETWREFPHRRGHPVPFRGLYHSQLHSSVFRRCFFDVFRSSKRREFGDNRPFWWIFSIWSLDCYQMYIA